MQIYGQPCTQLDSVEESLAEGLPGHCVLKHFDEIRSITVRTHEGLMYPRCLVNSRRQQPIRIEAPNRRVYSHQKIAEGRLAIRRFPLLQAPATPAAESVSRIAVNWTKRMDLSGQRLQRASIEY